MCVLYVRFFFQSVFGAGTPVASFPVARREPAFRLLFNKPADRAYWLWMDGDPCGERERERRGGEEERRRGGRRREGGRMHRQRRRGRKCAGGRIDGGVVDNMTLIHLLTFIQECCHGDAQPSMVFF